MKINKSNYIQFITAASLLTTGGGVPINDQINTLSKIKNLSVDVLPLKKFPKKSFLFTAAEIGPSTAPEINKKAIVNKMFNQLKKDVNYPISGIYPFEIGQESIVLETAHFLKLPIADFDPAGFRAVPFADISIFNIKKIRVLYSPLVICSDREEIFIASGNISFERAEEIMREMTSLSSNKIVFYLGALVKVNDVIKNDIENNSYSELIKIGNIKDISDLEKELKPKIVFNCEVLKEEEKQQKGFIYKKVYFKNEEGNKFVLFILNEAISIIDHKNNIISCVPERILLLDEKNLKGMPSGYLKKGVKFKIFILKAPNGWNSKSAKINFGLNRFKDIFGIS